MKTFQDFSIPGLQTVEGQNYSFNAASKDYKRYQMMTVLSSENNRS